MERFNYVRSEYTGKTEKRLTNIETRDRSKKGLSNPKSPEKKKSKKRRRSHKEGLVFLDFRLKPKEFGRNFMRETSKPVTIYERAA